MSRVARSRHPRRGVTNNLPPPLTKFVGRTAELESLPALLRDARLVTITGTGGAGKTRLAAEVARITSDEWPDGVFWVELAGSDGVASAFVASAKLPGQGRPIDVATSWISTRQMLLVLDNCEQMIEASAEFCDAAIAACPNLTVLATSREPVRVPGEARWPLAALSAGEAVELFEARAQLLQPDFSAGAQRDTIAHICERLDRLPLAIEMAASRLDVMSESEVLANLNDRFRILASGSRTAPSRQQTMRATIDWSHRLLSENEQQLFRRLAVFQGGFTIDAAETVCFDAREASAFELLTSLIQKSMVVADRLSDGSMRYRLLESHHAFAAEKLDQSGERDALSLRHYRYFADHGVPAPESANAWSAIEWARGHTDEMGLDLAVQVAESEFTDSSRTQAVLLDLLDRSPAGGSVRARGQNIAARLAGMHGDFATAGSLATQSLTLAREIGDPALLAGIVSGAGMVSHGRGELDLARDLYSEALGLLDGSKDRRLTTEVSNCLGVLAVERGDYMGAESILSECVARSRADKDSFGVARHLESLANARLRLGDVDGAAEAWRESLTIFRDLNDPFGTIWCLGGLALVAASRGDHERTLRLSAVVSSMSRTWSLSTGPTREELLKRAGARARTRLGARQAREAVSAGEAMTTLSAIDYALAEPAAGTPVDMGPLSRREREVVRLIAAGLTNRDIAKRLFITERTAEGHVERIRNKLGFRSRTEIAAWAVERGLRTGGVDKS